ncbi:effector-associated constant component EACC1 [Nocardiopsis aegyptia]|uniref:Uncharacterized protein n=1 Tax=Nocardiopsis aegyptia TaxID=220378 RepID=A0A7Z0JDS8_9ACTN|nr:hypothetical protein [Nocardiopsis aegyptia]NYJ37800.1 hypothetical protein [Nocardiopsis aegyptia]
METSLQILLTEEEASAEQIEELSGRLRRELLQLDVDDVTPVRSAGAPLGARGWDMAQVGALLVIMNQSVTALGAVVGAVRRWRDRCRERPTIRLEIDGDVLEISETSPELTARAFELFVDRHSPAGDRP